MIIYEGAAAEDQPITGKESAPETGKRILAAARAGRRFMHFSNCEQNLKDTCLTQAITNPTICGRNLGTNDPKVDITIPNEMEFSLSFNLGISIGEDLGPRSRQISLAFSEEDPNSRTFPDPHLHRTIKSKRAKILSAFAAIFKHWAKAGFPNGSTPFASFIDWAEIIGGVMLAHREAMYTAFDPLPIDDKPQIKHASAPRQWGDPCLPWADDFAESVLDRRTAAMTALFIVCEAEFGDRWIKNKAIIGCVTKHQTSLDADEEEATDQKEEEGPPLTDVRLDALNYFRRLDQGEDAHKNNGNLMRALRAFKSRILASIKLRIEPNTSSKKRDLYKFDKIAPRCPSSTGGSQDAPKPVPASGNNTSQYTFASKPVPTVPICPIFPINAYAGEKKVGPEVNTSVQEKNEKRESVGSHSRKNGSNGDNGYASWASCLALDLETWAEPKIGRSGRITATGDALDTFKGDIRLVTLADPSGNIRLFDLRETPSLPPEILAALNSSELLIHHAAFELRFLATKFGLWPERIFCTLTASKLLEPLKSVRHSLGPVLERYLDVKLAKEHGGTDWGAMMLTACQLQYARDDVRYLHRLRLILAKALEEADLAHVFALEMALLPIITRMELHGFTANVDQLRTLLPAQEAKAALKLQVVRQAFGKPVFNPNSSDQVLEVFKEAGIELVKSNPDGSEKETTDEELLCTIADPRAQLVLEYRKADKLATTLAALLEAVRQDGKNYAQFNPLGASTGRFSSKNPNLQQVPKKGARHVRALFVPSIADRRLIVADYSQIELRVAALITGEAVMINAFKERTDLHSKIAAVSLRIPAAQVTSEQRDIGKTINFGFLYGRSAEGYRSGVRKDYGLILTSEQARDYRASFFATYPAICAWHEDCRRKAKDPGNDRARTIFGRLLCAQIDDAWARFNLWTNYVVQGACADLLKMAMVKISSIMPSDVHLVATVHDELIYDVPADLALQCCDMIRLAMEEAFVEMFGTKVPIVAEAKVCGNWGQK